MVDQLVLLGGGLVELQHHFAKWCGILGPWIGVKTSFHSKFFHPGQTFHLGPLLWWQLSQTAKLGQNLGLGHAGQHDLDTQAMKRANQPDLDLVSMLHRVICVYGVNVHAIASCVGGYTFQLTYLKKHHDKQLVVEGVSWKLTKCLLNCR